MAASCVPEPRGAAAPAPRFPAGLLPGLLLLALLATPVTADQGFAAWLAGFRREAEAAGISAATLDRACARMAPLLSVLELDRRQPERGMGFDRYLRRALPRKRVAQGRARLAQHRALLERIAAEYQVPAPYLVALWGIESDFGRNCGRTSVLDALATLAYGSRRPELFRGELLEALRMVDAGQAPLEQLRGSWAGAMGQCQFMPSTYRRWAVDHDGDGQADIWGSLEDAFASMARYLAGLGWRQDQPWGQPVRLPAGLAGPASPAPECLPLSRWQELGVRRHDGGDLPAAPLDACLVRPDGAAGSAFLVYGNYRCLKEWNRSTYFALTIGHFADRLAAP